MGYDCVLVTQKGVGVGAGVALYLAELCLNKPDKKGAAFMNESATRCFSVYHVC